MSISTKFKLSRTKLVLAIVVLFLILLCLFWFYKLNNHAIALKSASYKAESPSAQDYMRVLERFPALLERGWTANYMDDSSMGYFGAPESEEMGLRSMGNFIFICSLLSMDPAYDPKVTGVDSDVLFDRARANLKYMTRSHVTGDITCGDGEKWGHHWQSSWWTARMAVGAYLLWARLNEQERAAVERVVVDEAQQQLDRKAMSRAYKDSKAEENAWSSEILAVAIAMFPDHEKSDLWREKLIEFTVNSLSAPQDRASNRLVDGRALKELIYTENIHSDFTIENHGAYHFCYMACPLHSLTWGYFALQKSGQKVPEAQFHHFLDVWKRAKPTFLESRFAYIQGKDWPRYAYGLYFIVPPLVLLQHEFQDADARVIELARFKSLEWEQIANADGSFFGKRFTDGVMNDRPLEYETDCYANLGLAYLLHDLKKWKMPDLPTVNQFKQNLVDSHISKESEFVYVRTPDFFSSFSWRELKSSDPIFLFAPEGSENMLEWGRRNLVGQLILDGIDEEDVQVQHEEELLPGGFKTRGKYQYHMKDGSPAYSQYIDVFVDSKKREAVLDNRFEADGDLRVNHIQGLRWLVVNDIFNQCRRNWHWSGGSKEVSYDPENQKPSSIKFESRWINLDDKVGIIDLENEKSTFVLLQTEQRNDADLGTIHYDLLCSPLRSGDLRFEKGDPIFHTRFKIISGDRKATAKVAELN